MSGFVDLWLDATASTIRQSTALGYGQKLGYLKTKYGGQQLGRLNGARLNILYSELVESGLSPSTVSQLHRVIHKMLKDAIRWGVLDSNPSDAADPPRFDRPAIRTWSGSEVARFLSAARVDDAWPLWQVAASTGMRRGELLGVRWEAVDLNAGTIEVELTIVGSGKGQHFSTPKTNAGRRSVALDRTTVTELRSHRVAQAERMREIGIAPEFVSSRISGEPFTPDWTTKQFRKSPTQQGCRRYGCTTSDTRGRPSH